MAVIHTCSMHAGAHVALRKPRRTRGSQLFEDHCIRNSGVKRYLCPSRVSEWLRNYEQFGYDGLLEGYRPGRPPALTPANKQTLEDIIDSGPLAYGYLSGVWTAPMIAQVIDVWSEHVGVADEEYSQDDRDVQIGRLTRWLCSLPPDTLQLLHDAMIAQLEGEQASPVFLRLVGQEPSACGEDTDQQKAVKPVSMPV